MTYGSLLNTLYDSATDGAGQVSVGDGATLLFWSDRHAATVIEVRRNGREIVIQEDTAIRTDSHGMSDAQSYRYERNTEGKRYVATLRKDGGFRLKGYGKRSGGSVKIGARQHYHDYSF